MKPDAPVVRLSCRGWSL